MSLHNDVLFSLLVVCQAVIEVSGELAARRGVRLEDYRRRLRWIVESKSRYCDLRPVRALLDAAVARRVLTGAFGRLRG